MSEYKEVQYPFCPVRCKEEQLANLAPIDGYVYFTTDTQKLFMAKGDNIMEMCAAKGFYYGQKNIEYDNSGNTPDPNVIFTLDEIEGNKLPEVDDLVLNIDGCFYRVTDVLNEYEVKTTRLTLQGTGTGGGGTGGGGEAVANLRISHYGGQSKYFSQEARKAELGVIAYSSDTANYISSIECSLVSDFSNIFLTVNNLTHPLEKPYYVDIVKQLPNISQRGTKVYLRVTDKYGSTRSINYTVSIASLQLNTSQAKLFGVTENSFDYRCTVGGSLDLDNRTIKYELYDENDISIYSTDYQLESNQTGTVTRTIDLSTVAHGSYTLRVKMVGSVSGTEITSNELTHKLLRYQEVVGQPIFTALIPNETEQYTDIPISYLLIFGDNIKNYAVDIIVDEKVESTQILTASTVSEYVLNFDKQGIYNLKLNIDELGVNFETTLNISKYTGVLPVVNIDRDDLKVYLTAKGRTNNASDKEYWPDYKNDVMKGQLSDFYFRSVNGWLTDTNKVNYLKASQGAKVLFDAYSPFNTEPKTSGLTIELDFRISGVLDYDAHLMECISRDNLGDIKTGFFITGNTFNYWASGKELVSLNIVEGQRIKLSYVIEPLESEKYPMCYTYLNGIISDVHNYQATDDFLNNPQNPGYLKIDSTNGQVDVYSVRFYSSALDAQTVLNNYQATLDTLELRQASYEQNLIRKITGDIDLELIEADSYDLEIPYVKIVGGYQAKKDMTMAEKTDANVQSLPVGKKDYRAIDIEVIYPKEHQNPYFKNYKDFKVTTTFEDSSLNVLNGFGQTPKTGAIMYAQGTSSLEYPVKNLRVKFKGDKIKVRPDLEAVNLITFKADFMESAGAHNTGAANFVDTVYEYVDMATPGQKQFANESIVTCIKGHPCVIFWSPTGERGTFEYIGKYNLNLDKATPEPFGFKEDENDPKFGFLTDENGNLVLDSEGKKQNSIFCFEFLDNNEKVCNFLSDAVSNANSALTTEKDRYYDTWYGDRENADKEIVPGWTIGFESRHPEDKVGLHDADALWPLASWLNELWALRATNYDAAIKRFKDEYQEYLDPEFLVAYYVITEALLMADSRVKNMMIATWGKEHRKFKTSDGVEKEVYNYIWYPIFYDMDTMLGLDNTGHVNKYYYDEDTDEGVFNGDEILWKFVRDALPNEVAQFYTRAEQANGILTKNGILPFFNANQANMANETFYNEDAFYKYIDTFRNGYTDHLNDKYIAPGTGERLYAAQGSRSMMREYFIENRIKYLRGKYSSTGYQSGDRIEFRVNYPVEATGELTEEQQRINASIKAVPPTGDFHFSSLKTGYAGVKIGQNGIPVNRRFVDEEDITISVDTSSANGTEAYLLGISNLSSIGDVSDKYLQNLIVGTSDNRLKSLIVGNHHKDYYNPYWTGVNNIGLNGFTYLEEFNLENCGSFTGALDFTDCAQIKKIYLNGSGATTLTLPPSGVIQELRVPTSINNFAIDSHPTLQPDKFTLGYFDYDSNTYVNDYSRLAHVSIKNTPIDSYDLIRKALILPAITRLESYCFQDVNWEITEVNDVILEGNEIKGIKVLDMLLNLAPYNGVNSHAEALTGKLVVNVGNYLINEYALYNIYHKEFPNLDIEYISSDIQSASTVKFYNSETIMGEPYYTVLTDGTVDLAYLISKEGPNGIALTTPIKVADNDEVFAFNGQWTVAQTAENSGFTQGQKINQSDFSSYKPKGDTIFTANYSSTPRTYKVTLYDDDGTTILLEEQLEWNQDIGAVLGTTNAELSYNYKEYDTETNPYGRYAFAGWLSSYDYNSGSTIPTWESLDGRLITGDFVAYACYTVEDVRYDATNLKYFDFTMKNNYEINGIKYSGYAIALKGLYKTVFRGPITLPSEYNGQSIRFVGNFNNATKITDVYFLENNEYYGILDQGFRMTVENQLTNAYLPKTDYFKFIGDEAFSNCYNLINIDIEGNNKLSDKIEFLGDRAFGINGFSFNSMQLNLIGLPANLQYLGQSAFYKGGPNINIEVLPETINVLEDWCLAGCDNVNISIFGTEQPGVGLTTIKNGALNNSGKKVEDILLLSSITTLSADNISSPGINYAAFENYAPNLKSFTSAKAASEILNQEGNPLNSFADVGIPEILITEAYQEV